MQVGAAAGIVTEVGIVAVEAALVATTVLIMYAGLWGFKVVRRAL